MCRYVLLLAAAQYEWFGCSILRIFRLPYKQQSADSLHDEADRCVPPEGSAQPPASMGTVLQLIERIESTLRSSVSFFNRSILPLFKIFIPLLRTFFCLIWLLLLQVSDRFEVAQDRKASLSRQLSALQDQQMHSERLWGVVLSGIADCERGSPVSAEELHTAIATADATRIRDESLFSRAQELLNAATAEAEACLSHIGSIADASEESVRVTRAMVERIQHFPLPADSLRVITQRAKVCAAVFESQRTNGVTAE